VLLYSLFYHCYAYLFKELRQPGSTVDKNIVKTFFIRKSICIDYQLPNSPTLLAKLDPLLLSVRTKADQ